MLGSKVPLQANEIQGKIAIITTIDMKKANKLHFLTNDYYTKCYRESSHVQCSGTLKPQEISKNKLFAMRYMQNVYLLDRDSREYWSRGNEHGERSNIRQGITCKILSLFGKENSRPYLSFTGPCLNNPENLNPLCLQTVTKGQIHQLFSLV